MRAAPFWQTQSVAVRLQKVSVAATETLSFGHHHRSPGAEAAAGMEASEEVAEIVAESAWAAVWQSGLGQMLFAVWARNSEAGAAAMAKEEQDPEVRCGIRVMHSRRPNGSSSGSGGSEAS